MEYSHINKVEVSKALSIMDHIARNIDKEIEEIENEVSKSHYDWSAYPGLQIAHNELRNILDNINGKIKSMGGYK